MSLTLLGLGAIIGTGIFVLTGVAAKNYAGPAIWMSFIIAGIVSALAALAYAELASMIPVSGSAYTYAYAGIGEIIAWIIAWDLILEYAVGAMTVSVGWSGYVSGLVADLTGYTVPDEWLFGPLEGGIMNVVAAVIVLAVTALLVVGIRESAGVTNFLVAIKVAVIIFIIVLGLGLITGTNYSDVYHSERGFGGVFTAAGLVFFAYIGFDALSTTAEETRNPKRDLPIGILSSLGISTLLYVMAALVITGMVRYTQIDEREPFAAAFRVVNGGEYAWAGNLIAASAVAGITSVLIVLLLSQPRIFFSMARDGLLPAFIAKVHPRFKTPYVATIITGLVVALVAGLTPISILATVTNIGTLFAFGLVTASVIILRYTDPHAKRGYRVPGPPWLLPGLGAAGALTLMLFLPLLTWLVFLTWFGFGLIIYSLYGYYKSKALAAAMEVAAPDAWGDVERVEDVEGIGAEYGRRLRAAGVADTRGLYEADAADLAARTGLSPKLIATWQSMADLIRVKGIGRQYAEVLVRAGYDSLESLAKAGPRQVVRSVERYVKSVEVPPTHGVVDDARAAAFIAGARGRIAAVKAAAARSAAESRRGAAAAER